MPYRRKNTKFWWSDYADANGKRVRRSTGTRNKKEAEALEAKWKLQVFNEKQWEAEPIRTFDDLLLAYLQATEGVKKSGWLDIHSAKPLYLFFSSRNLNEINGGQIRAYTASRKAEGKSDSSIRRELALFSSAINYARREWEWDINNPVLGRLPKKPESRVRWINREEADRLIEAADKSRSKHLTDFIQLALHSGCRRNELLFLQWDSVDLRENLVHLRGAMTKSGKSRTIPLNDQARKAMLCRASFRAEQCPGSPWVFATKDGERVKSVRTGFLAACKRAGIENFRIHDMRHTFAAWLVTEGIALPVIRDLLGHSSVVMTEIYAHLSPETGRAAVSVLNDSRHIYVTVSQEDKKIG